MIHVAVDGWYQTRTFSFARSEVVIGCAPEVDLVLDREGVAARHVQLTLRDGGLYIDDLMRQRPGTAPVEPPVLIQIAGIMLRVSLVPLEPEHVAGEIEWKLVDEIAARPDDPAPRLVYADWLDEHDQPARAEFLRVQLAANAATSADDPAFRAAAERLVALAPQVGIGWRALVATTFVEKCPTKRRRTKLRPIPADDPLDMELVCPMRWDKLEPTQTPGVRSCGACKREVTYCTSIEQARTIAQSGGCIAVDIANQREADDLSPPLMLGRPAPPFSRYGRR